MKTRRIQGRPMLTRFQDYNNVYVFLNYSDFTRRIIIRDMLLLEEEYIEGVGVTKVTFTTCFTCFYILHVNNYLRYIVALIHMSIL